MLCLELLLILIILFFIQVFCVDKQNSLTPKEKKHLHQENVQEAASFKFELLDYKLPVCDA